MGLAEQCKRKPGTFQQISPFLYTEERANEQQSTVSLNLPSLCVSCTVYKNMQYYETEGEVEESRKTRLLMTGLESPDSFPGSF